MKASQGLLASLCIVGLFFSGTSFADFKPIEKSEKLEISRFYVLLGQELRQQKSEAHDYDFKTLGNFSLGVGLGPVNIFLERANYSDSETTGNLFIQTAYESYSFWGQLEAIEQDWGVPYFVAGVGAAKTKVDTTLFAATSHDESTWKALFGLGCGFRAPVKLFWIGAEARLVSNQDWTPNPSLHLLGRVGMYF